MQIIPAQPIWGQTLQPGYCGFITREKDLVGDGIAWFERWADSDGGIPFVHTFIIEGPAPAAGSGDWPEGEPATRNLQPSTINIIEAHAQLGVHRATLDEYLGQKNCQCFVRIPQGYTDPIGQEIVEEAQRHLGEKYGFGLIVADLLANCYFGHLLNSWTHDIPDRLVCKLFTDRHHKICSQLVALALKSQHYLTLRGCLKRPSDTILPAELGNDSSVFGSLAYKIS